GEPTPACVDGKQCEVQTERRHRGDEDSPGHEDSGMDQPVGAPSRCVGYAMYKRESEAGGARGNDSRRCEQTRVARRGSHGDARRRSDALADAVRQASRLSASPRRRSGAIAMASTCAEVDDKAMASSESTRNPMSAGTVRADKNPAAEGGLEWGTSRSSVCSSWEVFLCMFLSRGGMLRRALRPCR